MRPLTRKEKKLAGLAGICFLAWATFVFGVSPQRQRWQRLTELVPQKQQELADLRKTIGHIEQIRNNSNQQATAESIAPADFSLAQFLSAQIDALGLRDRLTALSEDVEPLSANRRRTVISLKFSGITLEKLLKLFSNIRNIPHTVRTDSITIRSTAENLEVSLLLSVMQKTGKN